MSDFTFNEFLTGILKFNDENVMHIGFNADTEDIIITNWNASADTAKTLQTNLNGGGGGGGDTLGERIANTLTTYTNETVTSIPERLFVGASNLTSVHFPNVTNVGSYAFDNTGILTLVLPKYYDQNAWQAFANMKLCTKIDIKGRSFSQQSFSGCLVLDTLILRNTSVVTIGNINVFNNSPFASGGTGGTLYVPSALVSSYQAASNWSTILGYATNSIQAIEGSQYENYYADGTPIE